MRTDYLGNPVSGTSDAALAGGAHVVLGVGKV
jgi:hypothetical protein